MHFMPIFHDFPIFGSYAARHWLCTVDFSPGFVGQGMITGAVIPLHMLLGSIVGWGILSPYAKHRGWAPGEVEDWATGSRGWIIWVSLASLLADASVKLAWFVFRPVWAAYIASRHPPSRTAAVQAGIDGYRRPPSSNNRHATYSHETHNEPDLHQPHIANETDSLLSQRDPSCLGRKQWSESPLQLRVLGLGFAISVAICTWVIHMLFRGLIKWYYTILAIGLSLPMAVVGIRSLAETDYNPESALGNFISTPFITALS
jgi:hypothetical protein